MMSKVVQYLLIFLFGYTNVAFWRGIWYLLDVFLFPDHLLISSLVSMAAGLLVLAPMLRCSAIGSVPMTTPTLDSDHGAYSDGIYGPATALISLFREEDK